MQPSTGQSSTHFGSSNAPTHSVHLSGSITKIGEQSIQLQIAPNVRIDVSRAAIVGYQGQAPVAEQHA